MPRRVAGWWLGCLACLRAHSAELPDWHGWWNIETEIPVLVTGMIRTPPPLRTELAELLRAALLKYRDTGSMRYCLPPRFVGLPPGDGFPDNALEFLLTPGRVTLLNEKGLTRRIYTDGRALPEDPEPSNTGTSAGRWDGQVLLVETRGIAADLPWPMALPGAPRIGAGASVTERIELIAEDRLQISAVLLAPELLAAPYRITTKWRRMPGHQFTELLDCVADDRLTDPQDGSLRFDLTPPADSTPVPR